MLELSLFNMSLVFTVNLMGQVPGLKLFLVNVSNYCLNVILPLYGWFLLERSFTLIT